MVAGVVLLLMAVAGCGARGESAPEAKSGAAASGLRNGTPPAKALRLHEIELPPGARRVAWAQDDGWSSYALAPSFRIPERRLDAFLRAVRVPRAGLEPGFSLEAVGTETAGWRKRPGRS